MPLEATMLIIDNSEYMRNGDYQPTRFQAQNDAVHTVFQTKTDSNPENTVGIMSMAGKGPEVLVTHSKDIGQILQALHVASSRIGGEIDIPTAIAIAQLALKHRENKNLRQRIIVFVGSPLTGEARDERAMVRLAKKLKKNNVAVDVVCFGDGLDEETGEGGEGTARGVMKAFVDSASSSDNSHLVTIPPGPHLLSDVLITSPILSADRSAAIPEELAQGGGGAAIPAEAGGSSGFEFGVDPSLDPELAMALRMSMQEAQAREAAEAASSVPQGAAAAGATATSTTTSTATASAAIPAEPTDDEEERLLQEALAMSESKPEGDDDDVDMDGDEDEDEDAAIAKAIEMSLKGEQGEDKKQGK